MQTPCPGPTVCLIRFKSKEVIAEQLVLHVKYDRGHAETQQRSPSPSEPTLRLLVRLWCDRPYVLSQTKAVAQIDAANIARHLSESNRSASLRLRASKKAFNNPT